MINSQQSRFEPLHLAFIGSGGLVILFIVAPLLGMFLKTSGIEMIETAGDPEVQNSIWLTLWTAMAGALTFGILAIPFAYILARKTFPLKRLVMGIIDLPIVVPHSAAGIAILGVISRDTLLGRMAEPLGLHLVGGPIGIIAAMSFVSIPFLINAARDGFLGVPEKLEKAALNMGASPFRVFFTISLPLAWKSILSGLILMWARGMSEFGAVVIVAYHPIVAPVLIYERFSAFGLKYARPVSVLFLMVCLIIFLLLRLLSGNKQNASNR
ncbi:ABC transporter permease [bacterium]|nr:ABC transporter permease [bacterium]